MHNASRHLREFDEFRLDLEKKVLWHSDEPVALPAKAVEVLCELVEKRGEVVTKDELLDHVWPDSFVEESVLSQNIHHLRKALKKLQVNGNPIQTIPRRGYRFAADVRDVGETVLLEREIIERELFAEVSEDSLRDLSLNIDASRSSLSKTRSSILFASFISTAAILSIGLALWWWAQPTSVAAVNNIKSVAVLPLKTLNEKDQNSTLALGLTDSLIGRLGRLNKFAVRPFSAVDKYNESGKDAIAFGRELRADSVLEGTIQQVDDRVRVNLRLIDVRDGTQLWTDSFDESESDVLKLQDSISHRVARVLLLRLTPNESELLAKKPTSNPEAYRLYLAGRDRWYKRDWSPDANEFYRRAIELDPNFALAYLGIADQYAFTYETSMAEEKLNKAIELDPTLHEAHATRGFLQTFHQWDWQGAERSFGRALELAPNSSKAHHWYGVYLSIRGRIDDAEREMEKALELDPTALVVMTDLAELYYFKRDYDRAETELQKVLTIDPTFINARMHLAKVRYKKGGSYFLEEAAFALFMQKRRKELGFAQEFDTSRLEHLLANKDETTLRENSLKSIVASIGKPGAALTLARYYSVVGNKEMAVDALARALESKTFILPFIAVDPLWDPLRSEPRFRDVLQKMNLSN
jgi:DNA-binding winged helix-turn-helix (wHTH) protein/TolB-like protein